MHNRTLPATLLALIISSPIANAQAARQTPISTHGSKLDNIATAPQPADFWQAVNAGSLASAQKFFRPADLNATDALQQPALLIAAGRGHGDIVAWLLQQGASVDITGPRSWTPLMAAVFNNHIGVAKQLLAQHA